MSHLVLAASLTEVKPFATYRPDVSIKYALNFVSQFLGYEPEMSVDVWTDKAYPDVSLQVVSQYHRNLMPLMTMLWIPSCKDLYFVLLFLPNRVSVSKTMVDSLSEAKDFATGWYRKGVIAETCRGYGNLQLLKLEDRVDKYPYDGFILRLT